MSFFYIISYFWFIILVYLIFAIIPLFIRFSFLGLPLPAYRPFPRFYTPFLWGELEFLADTPFKSIIFFHLGSSRAALLGLNNLFLVSLFVGSVRSMPHLSTDKAAALQPPHSAALPMEDPRPDRVASSLRSAALPHGFALFIRGPTPSHGPTPEVTWFPGSVFRRSRYTPTRFLSSVSASVPHLSPQVLSPPPRGFIPINLFIRPLVCASINASNPINN